MSILYKVKLTREQRDLLEEFTRQMGEVMGVTQVGNRVTCRLEFRGKSCDVQMIIENVTTPSEVYEMEKDYKEWLKPL